MKKIYTAPIIEMTIFDSGDSTNTALALSGNFKNTKLNGVGSVTYKDMFDY